MNIRGTKLFGKIRRKQCPFEWKEVHVITTRNLVICNHLNCNYMWLHATTYNLELYFIIFTTNHHLLNFSNILTTIKLHILPYWLAFWIFHPIISSYVHLVAKLVTIWLLIRCVYTFNVHRGFVNYIKSMLYRFYSRYIKHLLSLFNTFKCI